MLHFWNQSATDENPVRDGTGKRVAKSDQRSRETIPTPRFARKPSTMKSFFPAEGSHPQKYVAEQQRLHPCWKIRSKTQVSACSGSPSAAMWYGSKKVDMVESVDDLKSSRSIPGYIHFPNFEMLDARIASALNKIIQNSYFKKKVSLGGTESSERKSVPSRKTGRSHDLRLLPGYWRS